MSYLQNVKFHFDNVHKWAPVRYGPILLHQVGDVICDRNFENGLHLQECYELRPHSFRFVFGICPDENDVLALSRTEFCAKTERLSETHKFDIKKEVKSVIECNINKD